MEKKKRTGMFRTALAITCAVIAVILLLLVKYPKKPTEEKQILIENTLLLQVFEQAKILTETELELETLSFKTISSKNSLITFLQTFKANGFNDWKINFLKDGLELLSSDQEIKLICFYEDLFPKVDSDFFDGNCFISYNLTRSYFQDGYIILSYERAFFRLIFTSLVLGGFIAIGIKYFSVKQYRLYKGRT